MPVTKLFTYPYDVFLKLRLEFEIICEKNELEAKLLRIIETYTEAARQALFVEAMNGSDAPDDQMIDITRNVWVPISHRLFMNDLYEVVKSANTVKAALDSLEQKKLILTRYDPKGRYDTIEYQLHSPVIQPLLDSIGKPGYQKLIPSIIDTLKKQESDPEEGYQKLTLSIIEGIKNRDPQKLTVSKIGTHYKKVNGNKKSDTDKKVNGNKNNDAPSEIVVTPQLLSQSAIASSSSVFIDKNTSLEERETKPPQEKIALPLQAIIQEWKACHEKDIKITDTLRMHANTLVGKSLARGELVACRDWLRENDARGWYAAHEGPHLGDIVRELENFRKAPKPFISTPDDPYGTKPTTPEISNVLPFPQAPVVDTPQALPAARFGMIRAYAERLAKQIRSDFPDATVDVRETSLTHYKVFMEYGGQSLLFSRSSEYDKTKVVSDGQNNNKSVVC